MPTATKKCLFCKERKRNEEMKQTPNRQWFCDSECIAKYANQKWQRQKNKNNNERKKEVKQNDLAHQHKLTQKAFNRMRALQELAEFKRLGIEPVCISCGKANMDWCCGHYKTVGSHGELRYSEINTYLQCNKYCNMSLSGNISGNKTTRGYTQGLKDRFGEDKAQDIFDYLDTFNKPAKWTGEQLIEMRKKFNKKIRELL